MPDDVLSMALAEDEEQPSIYAEKGLGRLSKLTSDLREKYARLHALEEDQAKIKGEIRDLETRQIPSLMTDLRMRNFELEDGSEIEVKRGHAVSLKEENRPAAMRWLEENNHTGVIKVSVSVEFGKGEFDQAVKLQKQVQTLTNREVVLDKSVHSQTLAAWGREMMSKENPLPSEKIPRVEDGGPFTVFDYVTTEIRVTRPGKRGKVKLK